MKALVKVFNLTPFFLNSLGAEFENFWVSY